MALSTIGMLWMEGPLSYLEQLCVKSFVDAGHEVIVYHYNPVQNIPDGVVLEDAAQYLPQDGFLLHKRTSSPALHSDVFRYKLLKKNKNMIWADTDAYCHRPFETDNGHFYGWESSSHINGGVLGLPPDSDTLNQLLEFTADEYAIPPYYGKDYEKDLTDAKAAGTPVHVSEQPWGVWGPHAITHFLHETGEVKYALPQDALYPFTFKDRRNMLKRKFDTSGIITENTRSIHFYGRRMRKRLVEKEGGIPHHKSLIGELLKKHDINPALAPLPEVSAPETPAGPARTPYKQKINLTDLADKYGSDKGSAKHRYSELYQLLFLPYRERKINFLEMGLLIGGPEHGNDKDRKTDDLPSIRMWLEFFPKAQIHGLDISDFSWFNHERFDFTRCDMDARENIAEAARSLPNMTIIIDDASHASHHQQYALLELWEKLEPGGMYIIEDLRWQPDAMEHQGITKTGDLLYEFQVNQAFSHSDTQIEAELNSLAPEISGCFVFQAGYNLKRRHQVAVLHKR